MIAKGGDNGDNKGDCVISGPVPLAAPKHPFSRLPLPTHKGLFTCEGISQSERTGLE